MQVALAGSGLLLSDGATNVMPVPPHRAGARGLTAEQIRENHTVVRRAWRLHYDHVRHSLVHAYYQGWDLHPAQLPTRYAAVYAFFLEGLDAAARRLTVSPRRPRRRRSWARSSTTPPPGRACSTSSCAASAAAPSPPRRPRATGLTLEEMQGPLVPEDPRGQEAAVDPVPSEWLNLLLRWFHVFAGILWIGQTWLFTWFEAHFEPPAARGARPRASFGWCTAAASTRSRSTRRPAVLPRTLHWFRWEAALTWMSGMGLLLLVYYAGGLLVDDRVADIGFATAAAIGLGLLVVVLVRLRRRSAARPWAGARRAGGLGLRPDRRPGLWPHPRAQRPRRLHARGRRARAR